MKKYFFYLILCLLANFILHARQVKASAGQQNPQNINHFNNNNDEDLIISQHRPRLFVKSDEAKVGRGVTVSGLRSRLNDPMYKNWINFSLELKGWASLPAIAMQYLLKGDKKNALTVGEYIANTPFSSKEHTSSAAAVYHSAIAFDWVRNELPDEMASKISAKLVEEAEHLKKGVISPAINHNYSIVSLYALATVAVAIYGEGEENNQKSLEYLRMIDNLLTSDNMLLDVFEQKEGTWGEGNHYSPYVVFYPFLMTLRGLTTATNVDYYTLIRNEYGNFIKPMSKFIIANFRPDFTLERIGDITGRVVPVGSFMRPLLELLASEIDDAELQGQVHSFSRSMANYYNTELVPDVYRWMMMVNYDSNLPDKPSYKTLPLVMRFGKNSYEHIMFRNSWEENGTLITYISGDHYTDHQHFDKGHFLIYKKGGLIIDGGGYGSPMYGDNWSNYSTRTLAHNNVLVYDSTDTPYHGINNTLIYPDGGQRVLRGVQSSQDWQNYLEMSKKKALNTADVIAFDDDHQFNRYNYVKTNLTNAYDTTTTWLDRQLLYLPLADYLIVKDRVITSKPLDKYWLLHFEETPQIDGKTPAIGINDYNEANIVRSQRTGKIELKSKSVQYSGRLFIKSLLPDRRTISLIGGPGYEYYNRFWDKNFSNSKAFEPIMEPGNWRMEVKAKKPAEATVFLHALEISDINKEVMIPTEFIKSEDGKMEGILFPSNEDPYIVFFSSSLDSRGHDFQKAQFPINYEIHASAQTSHILVELEPDKKVNVYINNQSIGTFKTSKAGGLTFKDKGSGARNIQIKAEE